jgi:hypothetical protein
MGVGLLTLLAVGVVAFAVRCALAVCALLKFTQRPSGRCGAGVPREPPADRAVREVIPFATADENRVVSCREDAMDRMNTILAQACRHLDDAEVSYDVTRDRAAVHTIFNGMHGVYSVRIAAAGDPAVLGVLVRVPVVVPRAQRVAMAEALARANDGLFMGSFELDFGEGLVRFRNTMPVGDAEVTAEQFRTLLFSAISTADRYFRACGRLVFGDDLSPAEVIAEVEMA